MSDLNLYAYKLQLLDDYPQGGRPGQPARQNRHPALR